MQDNIVTIHRDKAGRYCLSDLKKIVEKKDVFIDWMKSQRVAMLIEEIEKTGITAITRRRGKVYAVGALFYDFAVRLNPKLIISIYNAFDSIMVGKTQELDALKWYEIKIVDIQIDTKINANKKRFIWKGEVIETLFEYHKQGMSDFQIAKKIGCNVDNIKKTGRRFGLDIKKETWKTQEWTDKERLVLRECFEANMFDWEIAEKLNHSPASVVGEWYKMQKNKVK